MKNLSLALVLLASSAFAQVQAAAQTPPVPGGGGTNDTAIWVHPTDVTLSRVFATDKVNGGLFAYGLDGGLIDLVPLSTVSLTRAVDVRYQVPFEGKARDLVLVVSTDSTFRLFAPDGGGMLGQVPTNTMTAAGMASAGALYLNPASKELSVFVADLTGLKQWQLTSDAGVLNATLVRNQAFPNVFSGLAVDDRSHALYAISNVGLFRVNADVDGGAFLDTLDPNATTGGLAIYPSASTGGYVIRSSGTNVFSVYALAVPFTLLGTFTIGPQSQGVSAVDVVPLSLGTPFDGGMLVAFDINAGNLKLVPFDAIAASVQGGPIAIDPTYDPRTGSSGAGSSDAGPDGGADGGSDGGRPDAGSNVCYRADGGTGVLTADAGCFPVINPGTTPPGAGGRGTGIHIPSWSPPQTSSKAGCGCGEAFMLFPLAAVLWLHRPLRRRRPSKE